MQVEINEQEGNALIDLLNVAVLHKGLGVAENAVYFAKKIKDAHTQSLMPKQPLSPIEAPVAPKPIKKLGRPLGKKLPKPSDPVANNFESLSEAI